MEDDYMKRVKRSATDPKWQQQILQNISEMDNVELMQATIDAGGGDDYDGCFTDRGEWEYGQLINELDKRLAACGYYTPEQYTRILDRTSEPYKKAVKDFYDAYPSFKFPLNNQYKTGTEEHYRYNLGWEEMVKENPHYFTD